MNMGTPKKILFLTGTRADFGKIKSLLRAIEADDDFEAYIFATGMHLLSKYGSTFDEIRKEEFHNVFLCFNQMTNTSSNMDMVLADTIKGLGHYVREFSPDLIVVHGDRVETLAGAIVGALNNILTAHIEGGELSGTVDELIRHSVTKLAHIHFVANNEARSRLIQMGEAPQSIYIIGSPDIDIMLSDSLPSLDTALEHYEIPFKDYGILLYHPVVTELDQLASNIHEVINGVRTSGRNFVVIYPNNDTGSDIIIAALQQQLKDNSRFCMFPSLRFEYFLRLLKHAQVIVGNSSAGIKEGTGYGIPVINIGSRQANRFQHKLIQNIPEDCEALNNALSSLPDRQEPSLHFGKGQSAQLLLAAIRTPEFWSHPLQKQFRDLSPLNPTNQNQQPEPHDATDSAGSKPFRKNNKLGAKLRKQNRVISDTRELTLGHPFYHA